MKISDDYKKLFAEWGRIGGRKAAKGMTKAQLSARAKKAVSAREAKRKGKSNGRKT